jgi:hypothetical protein
MKREPATIKFLLETCVVWALLAVLGMSFLFE